MINFNQLRIFYYTAKYQSCTMAAEKLFITQPAVTSQIKAFEESCNLTLFKKMGRKIYLTDEGKSLYEYARKVFEYEKEIEDDIEDMRALKKGVLRLGTTKTYARSYMSLLISKFWRSYPNVKIILNEGSSLEIASSLLDFKSEIAIIAKIEESPEICFLPFCQEDIVALVSPDHHLAKRNSITMAELAEEPIIMKECGSGTRKAVDEAFAGKGVAPNILMEINNTYFIKQVAMRGDGISFLVRAAASAELEEGKLIALSIQDCQIFAEASIAYLRNQHLSKPAQAFLVMLKELFSGGTPLQSLSSLVTRIAVPAGRGDIHLTRHPSRVDYKQSRYG
jgi:DNA-binding transcriptional LysR family regulator